MFENVVDPVLSPLLRLGSFWTIFIISIVLSVVITLIYKFMTNQKKMKELRETIKKHQTDMKGLKHDPKKMMAAQKQAMEANMHYMMQSFRPMIVTFIPIILIFGWLNANLAYDPLQSGEEFTITATFSRGVTGDAGIVGAEGLQVLSDTTQPIINGMAVWNLQGEEGEYIVQYKYNGEILDQELVIGEGDFKKPIKAHKGSSIRRTVIGNKPIIVMNIFGWKVGWLGTYIVFSLIFSFLFRKLLKLY